MATLLHAAGLGLAFGSRTVFDSLTLTVEEGERVGLVGPNGSGKSSLMKMLARAMAPDRGDLQLRRGARVTYLPQEPEFPAGATVESELAVPDPELRVALAEHTALAHGGDLSAMEKLGVLSERIERLGGWDTAHQAREMLERLGVTAWEQGVAELSGGTRKRVAIARALLTRPDLLLLDEPTNHLDADTVDWLEEELDTFSGALLLVTHDRYFLDDLVDRIVEIQPGSGVTSYPGNYEAYLLQKLEAEENAAVAEHKRSRWISQEVAWLGRGVEARRTKSKARIQRAKKLMAERSWQRPKVAELQLASAPRLGHTVIEAEHLNKSFGARPVLKDVGFHLQRGERVGLVGPNGVGKTTFLRVLLGELPPDSGKIAVGKSTVVAYYDQQRATLDPELTVYDAAGGSDVEQVEVGGRTMQLRDYLDDLLFPVPMQRQKVAALSGGERNRLLLARLFLQGANLLVLDEPTNDLDIVTLNVLERLLLGFSGSVLLVTHDRYFLDKVATAIVAFEGGGRVVRYAGNFESYRAQRPKVRPASGQAGSQKPAGAPGPDRTARRPTKLSFKDQRELEGIETAVELAEQRRLAAEAALADPETYVSASPTRVPDLKAELAVASREVERLYARWQELQDLAAQAR
jgi:ABC transport system ATP-binding/permease protein